MTGTSSLGVQLDQLAEEIGRLQRLTLQFAPVLALHGGRVVVLVPVIDDRAFVPARPASPTKRRRRTPWLARFERVAARLRVTLEEGPLPEGTLGLSLRGRRVRLRRDVSEVDQTTTLIHELAHILLGHFHVSNRLDVLECELEAEAVAWLVATQLGLHSEAPLQLAAMGAPAEHLRAARKKIGRVAGRLLKVAFQSI